MDWLKYKKIYFAISGILLAISIFSLAMWKLLPSIDFTGGSAIAYQFEEEIETDVVFGKLQERQIDIKSIQKEADKSYLFKFAFIDNEEKQEIEKALTEVFQGRGFIEERFETVGPSIGPELVKKTLYASLVTAVVILLWVAYQFKSLKFGTSAILAMLHDTFILIGVFSLLGHFFRVEVDFLFVTALLTTLSFSVHDTIVVFDRIRENKKKYGGELEDVANASISQTMTRSLNNSFTIIFMLVALILLGGVTIKWFALALFIGTVLGTYSSPFVAVPILTLWDSLFENFSQRLIKIKR